MYIGTTQMCYLVPLFFFEETMAESIKVEAGGHWSGVVPKGEALTIIDLKGGRALIFFATTLINPRSGITRPTR